MRSFLKGSPVAHIIFICLLGMLIYSTTINDRWHFDDNMYITDNPILRDARLLLSPSDAEVAAFYGDVGPTRLTRLMGYLSFYLNYQTHGLDVRGYHIVNILIHLINASLLYLLVLNTFQTPMMQGSAIAGKRHFVALLAGALFVAHPVQTQAVTYLSQRFASLATTFYLLSLLSYALWRLSSEKRGRYAYYALSLASAAMAMAAKEISFTLPLAIVLFEFSFFKGGTKKRLIPLVPILLTMLIIPLLLLDAGAPIGQALDAATKTQIELSRHDYMITQIRVMATYLRLLALPVNQNLDYDYPIYDSFFAPQVAASAALVLCIFILALYSYRRSARGEPALRLIGFGMLWFFLAILVESSVIALADVIFEHRLYLPSAGMFLAFSAGAIAIVERLKTERMRQAAAVILALAVFAYSVAAYQRNAVWGSETTLWEDVVRKSPEKARGYNSLGKAYCDTGRYDEAIETYLAALRLDPQYAKAHNGLGVALSSVDRTDEALGHFLYAISLDPYYVDAHFNLGIVCLEKGYATRAARQFKTVLSINPWHSGARKFLNYIISGQGL